MNNCTCYREPPHSEVDGIPVFSQFDDYVDNYERISRDHLDHLEKTGHNPFMHEDHWQEIETSTLSLVRKYVASRARILDVGVGMGRLLEQALEFERFGMDIAMGYLQCAKKKGINVCMSKIEDMPYLDEFFDAIVITDVLEHVLDVNLALKKILDVLKPNGFLIIRVPYQEDLNPYLNPSYPYDLVHLRTFDSPSLRLLLEKVFRLKTHEIVLTGYVGGQLKYWIPPLPKLRGLVRWLVDFTKVFGVSFFERLSRRINKPTEINVVVQKAG